jgi:hypothetical protein
VVPGYSVASHINVIPQGMHEYTKAPEDAQGKGGRVSKNWDQESENRHM